MKRSILCALFLASLAGCHAAKDNQQTQVNMIGQAERVSCPDVRSKICTREWNPVCGTLGDTIKTYGNACTACADANVQGYILGVCEKTKSPKQPQTQNHP